MAAVFPSRKFTPSQRSREQNKPIDYLSYCCVATSRNPFLNGLNRLPVELNPRC
jgi:hypothetical protein